MNEILEFDYKNRNIRVEPGVLNIEVQKKAEEHGLFWPPDPSSAEYCSVGGNLACNAAGPRAVKYGTCRENTLSLTAITGAGDTIHTGSATTKGVVGLDLTRLLIGSEGILAIITEARLKLSPKPERINTIRAFYKNSNAAIEAVVSVLAQNALPYALEFIDSGSLNLIRQHSNLDIDTQAQAMLMIEVDGLQNSIDASTQAVLNAANINGCINIQTATDQQQKIELWAARKALSPALRSFAPNKINEDVVVPVTQLPTLLKELEKLSNKHDIAIFNFGHAGNGNLHVNLLYDASNQAETAKTCLSEVFELVLKLGGTLSGEHGVGIAKRDFVSKEIDATTLALMQKIKQQFDPNNILNPGKTLPEQMDV
jgi:D-lactate dehydrogenase